MTPNAYGVSFGGVLRFHNGDGYTTPRVLNTPPPPRPLPCVNSNTGSEGSAHTVCLPSGHVALGVFSSETGV